MPIHPGKYVDRYGADGEYYFRKIGLLDSTMPKLLDFNDSMVAPDASTSGTTVSTSESLVKQTHTLADMVTSWNLPDSGSSSYEKVLYVGYGISDWFALVISETEFTGTPAGSYMIDSYMFRSNDSRMYSSAGGVWANFATDNSFAPNDNTNNYGIIGIALYVDGPGQIQRAFYATSKGQWTPILSTTDTAVGSSDYKSVGAYTYDTKKRQVSPLVVWGKKA